MSPLTLIRELRLHLRAWEKHKIYFGTSCARSRLSLCQPLFSAVCVGTEMNELPSIATPGINLAIRLPDDALTYRFSHGYPDPQMRGECNPHFLDASSVRQSILALPKSMYTLIFPLAHIYKTEALRCQEFLDKLDGFFAALPGERRYAIEIQNSGYLLPQYFACLARHGITHVINDSATMPSLLDQIQWPDALTAHRAVVCSIASSDPEWQLGILETVRRCISEKKELCVYLTDGGSCSVEGALHLLVDLLTPDLAKLSPLRRRAA